MNRLLNEAAAIVCTVSLSVCADAQMTGDRQSLSALARGFRFAQRSNIHRDNPRCKTNQDLCRKTSTLCSLRLRTFCIWPCANISQGITIVKIVSWMLTFPAIRYMKIFPVVY